LLSTAIYVSEQVYIGWHRTGAYYTAKLTFFQDFSVNVWGAYYTSKHIIFKLLQYMSYNSCPVLNLDTVHVLTSRESLKDLFEHVNNRTILDFIKETHFYNQL